MTGNNRRGTRDRIIATAASLIIERGMDRTSLEDVRQVVSVTQAQLAEHFPDKTALFRGVLTRSPGVVPESPTHQALRNLDSLQALERWADLYVRQQQGNDFRGSCLLAGQMGRGRGERARRRRSWIRPMDGRDLRWTALHARPRGAAAGGRPG